MTRIQRDQPDAETPSLQSISGVEEALAAPLAEIQPWRGLEPLEPRLLLSAVIDYNPLDTLSDDEEENPIVLEQDAYLTAEGDEGASVGDGGDDDVPVFSLSDTDESTDFSTFMSEEGDSDEGTLDSITALTVDEPLRPVLILPGIGGTLWAEGHEDEWYTTRGIHPDKLVEDPLAGVYDDLIASFENVGYTRGEDLFVANYDWRMSPGPRPDSAGDIDGTISGLTPESITDDTFETGVDYLGHWLEEAAWQWQQAGKGVLDDVDIVAHSTGGLVARSYLQADFYETDTTLPKIHNLLMAAVPHRGASKTWNPLNNDWGVDPAMRVVLSKIGNEAFERVLDGQQITGADGDTITADDFDGMSDEEAQLDFIRRYVPTVNDLLATYEFFFDGDDPSETLESINDPSHEHSGLRNSLLLDLNDGLDLHYSAEDIAADGTYTDTDTGHVYRPNDFVEGLTGEAYLIYNDQVPTNTTVSSHTGPISGETNLLVPMDQFIGEPPEADQDWYKDHGKDTDEPGDGTVPLASLTGQFENDSRFQLINLDAEESVDHTGIMHDRAAQSEMLDILLAETDIDYSYYGDISSQLAPDTFEMLLNVVSHDLLNPADLMENETLHDEMASGLVTLTQAAQTFVLRTLGGGGWVNSVPGLDLHIRDAIKLDEVVEDFAFGPFRQWIGNPEAPSWVEPTTDALVDTWLALDGLTTASGVELSIDADRTFAGLLTSTNSEIADAMGFTAAVGDDQLLFNLALTAEYDGDAPLDLEFEDDLLELLGVADVAYSASATVDITFGYDLDNSLDPEERAFLRINDLSADLDVDVSDLNPSLRVGFVEGEIYDGALNIHANISGRYAHADDDPQRRLRQSTLDEGLDDEAWLRANFITEHAATVEATLPARVTIGDYTTGAGTEIAISGEGELFAHNFEFAYVDFEELWSFTTLDAGSVMDLFQRAALGLAEADDSPVLDVPIPFAQGLTVGDVLDFEQALEESVISEFVDEDGYFTFHTFEEFVDQLATVAGVSTDDLNLDYDPATQELSYHVPFSLALTPDAVQFDLGVDAGPLFDIRSGGLVELSALVTGGFTVGMQLTPLQAAVTADRAAPQDGRLSSTARFDLAVGGDDPVTISVSRDHENESIDDLVEDVNAALLAAGVADRVTARRNEDDPDRIELVTQGRWTGSASLRLTNPNSYAEDELGFNPLHFGGDGVLERAFLDDVALQAELNVTAEDIDAFGRFGFLDIDVDGANGSVTATADYELVNPDDGSSRIALLDLPGHLRDDPQATIGGDGFAGSAHAVLPISVNPNPFGSDHPDDPTITLDWADLTDVDTLELSYNEAMEELAGYGELDFATIVGSLGNLAELLGDEMQELPWLSEDLPLLNRSVADLFDLAGGFANKVAAIADDPSATLDELSDRLADALGLESDDVSIALETGMLRMDLGLSEMFSTEVPLQLDLVELFADDLPDSLAGLADLVTAGTDGKLTVDAEVLFDLAIGFDISDPNAAPTPVVFDSTGVDVGLNITGTDLEGQLGIDGFAAVNILGGSAFLGDESDPKDMARFTVGLNPVAEGRYNLVDLAAADFEVALTGSASAALPLYFPTPSDPLRDEQDEPDAHHLVLSIGDLSDPVNTADVSAPDLAGLLDGLTLRDQLGYLLVGLDYLLEQVQSTLERDVFSTSLPIIGDQLVNAGDAIEDLREGILTDLRAALENAPNKATDVVREKLFEVLGPDGLSVLGDLNDDDDITLDDVMIPIDENDEVQFHLQLTPASFDLGGNVDFDLALPGLDLDLDVNPEVALAMTFDLVFGVSEADGFYFDTTGDQVTADLEITIPDSSFSGRLAFLDLAVDDRGSSFSAGLAVDITAPGNRLRWDEIVDAGNALDVNVGFSGGARLDLDLTVSFDGFAVLPSMSTRFVADWNFDLNGIDAPAIAFHDVTLDPGEFIDNFVTPILDQVQEIIEPVRPIIDFLTTELPVISDLLGEMTVLDLVKWLPDRWAFVDGELVEAFAGLLDVIDTLDAIALVDGVIELGSFDLTDADGLGEFGGLLDFDPNVTETPDDSPLAQFAALSSDAADFVDNSSDLGDSGSGLEFPLLADPGRAFRLLLGQPVELFTFDMPHIEFLLEFSQNFLVWTPPEISINLSGELGGRIDLGFGYDTTGLMRYRDTGEVSDILSGFYISDRANADGTGADVPEAKLWGALLPGLKVGLGGAGIGVYGGLRATLYGDLNDPNNDGKVHVHEFVRSARNGEEGLWCTFDLTGEVAGVLGVFFEAAGEQVRQELVNEVLWDFSIFDGPCFPGRFEANETPDVAADLGAAPGVHIVNGRIIDEYDRDWYRFELLRDDSVEMLFEHAQAEGDLDVEIYDADYNRIARAKSQTDDEQLVLKNLEAGEYYIYAFGNGDPVDYTINIDPYVDAEDPASSSTNVYYVADPESFYPKWLNYYATEAGDDEEHDGRSHDSPLATIGELLSRYTLGPDDLVVIDGGRYNETVVLTADHAGAAFAGAPIPHRTLSDYLSEHDLDYEFDNPGGVISSTHITGDEGVGLRLDGATDVLIHSMEIYELEVASDSADNIIQHSRFRGAVGVHFLGGEDHNPVNNTVQHSVFASSLGVQVDSAEAQTIADSSFSSRGVLVTAGAAAEIRDNSFEGDEHAYAVRFEVDAVVTLQNNDISGYETGVINHSFDVSFVENRIFDNEVGMTGTGLLGSQEAAGDTNAIFDNEIGILLAAATADAIVQHNDVYDNEVGIRSEGPHENLIQGNRVYENTVGIEGGAVVGGVDWSAPNEVYENLEVGILAAAEAEIRFNRIHENPLGIRAADDVHVHHNVLYRGDVPEEGTPVELEDHAADGDVIAILLESASDVLLENNTIYAPIGHAVVIASSSRDTRVRNNIIHVRDGYGLHISDDSQPGFASNYNNLYSSDDGILVHWQKDFADIYDWQMELGQDLDSIGYTTVHPTLDEPAFVNRGEDDYRLSETSTSIDAGDPASDYAVEVDHLAEHGGRVNLGAYGNTAQAAESVASWVSLAWPVYHVDWFADRGAEIRWDTYNVEGDIRLTVEDADTGATVATIGEFAADEGSTLWSPDNHDLPADAAERYRIRITSVADEAVTELMRESFAVIDAEANDYYINDSSTDDAQYTTAVGDNRNTGTTADDPKASLLAMLRMYSLGPNDTVHVDTGDYLLPANAVISGVSGIGNDEGVTITGPTDADKQATLNRGMSLAGSAVVELHGADFTTLSHLSLVGGERGLYVHSTSTFFDGSHLEVSEAATDGVTLSSSSTGSTLSDLHVHDNAGHGVVVQTELPSLTDSHIHDNAGTGLYLEDVGDMRVQRNTIHDNDYGIDVDNGVSGTMTLIGSTDLAAADGNEIYDNESRGVEARGQVLVAGNSIHGHAGLTAVYLVAGADASHNVIDGSRIGIHSNGTSAERVEYNRVTGSSFAGIYAESNTQIVGNVLDGNHYGIRTGGRAFSGLMANNIIHDSAVIGLYLHNSAGTPELVNNTIVEPTADAVVLNNSTPNVHLRNNIIQVGEGVGLTVGTASHVGFSSDFNLFHVTGAGALGSWQGTVLSSLAAWRSATFNDQLSLEQDPRFVDVAGRDLHLQSAYGSFHGGTLAPVIDPATLLPTNDDGTLTDDAASSAGIDRGDDGDSFDNEPGPNGGYINLGAYGNTAQASLSPEEYVLLISPVGGEVWPAEQTFPILWRSHELSAPNLLANPGAEESPVDSGWTEVIGSTWGQRSGNPSPYEGDNYFFAGSGPLHELQQEVDLSAYAEAIDAGDQSFEFEGFVRSYDQASPDSSRIVVEYLDADGEILEDFDSGEITNRDAWERVADDRLAPEGTRSARIRLIATRYSGNNNDGYFDALSFKPVNTMRIELLEQDGEDLLPVRTIGSHEANDGRFDWTIPSDIDPDDDYKIRITPNDSPSLSDVSFDPFQITEPVAHYYVNIADDGDLSDNVYTTAAGDSILNDGLSPDTPMDSIRAVLETYDLGVGDTIFVDTGVYELSTNITIDAANAGVSIVGAYDPTDPTVQTVIDRDDSSSGSYAFDLADLDLGDEPSLVLENLYITGGYDGIHASRDAGAHGVHIVNSTLEGHSRHGIFADVGNDGWQVTGSTVIGHSTGADFAGHDHTFIGNTFRDATSRGLYLNGDRAHLEANIFRDNRTGFYSVSNTETVVVDNAFFDNSYNGAEVRGTHSAVAGNVFHHNDNLGLYIRGGNSVAGPYDGWGANEFYENNGAINVTGGAFANGNLVYDNNRGIWVEGLSGAGAIGNTIYNNSGYGIHARSGAVITHNVVYGNDRGIDALGTGRAFSGTIANNLVYDNANYGIRVDQTSGTPEVINNTVIQDQGVAIDVLAGASRLDMRNNLVQVHDATAIRVDQAAQVGLTSDYNLYHVTGSGTLFEWGAQTYDSRAAFFHATSLEAHSIVAAPAFVDAAADDYRLLPSSPAIDAGDPQSPYHNEPTPNGGRVNIGAFGNTAEATPGTEDLLDILAPHASDKHELGGSIDLAWRTHLADLSDRYADIALQNDPVVYYRLNDEQGDTVTDSSGHDRHGEIVYDPEWGARGVLGPNYGSALRLDGYSNHIVYDDADGDLDLTHNVSMGMWINVEDTNRTWTPLIHKGEATGNDDDVTFALWMHDADRSLRLITADGQGAQVLDTDVDLIGDDGWHHVGAVIDRDSGQMRIYVDGQVVATQSVRQEEAVSSDEPLYVMRSAQNPYAHAPFEGRIDEVAIYDAALADAHYEERAFGFRGTVDIELLAWNGSDYDVVSTIADDVVDYGRYDWDVPTDELDTTTEYAIRITSSLDAGLQDQTEHFRFAPDGDVYYVNDNSLDDDLYTEAVGDNLNHGKSADAPMASLAALLDAYELDAGDTVYVDSGLYELERNIDVTSVHSGVTIIGAHDADNPDAETIFDRGRRSGGYYGFELTGATDVTLEHLHVTNANIGVYAAEDAGNDGLTIRDSVFSYNIEAGVRVLRGNDGLLVEGSTFYGQNPSNHNDPQKQEIGLHYEGTGGTIRENVAYDHYNHGFSLGITYGASGNYLVEHNTAYNNRQYGINARGASESSFLHNELFDNDYGIYVNDDNTVVSHTHAYGNEIGIYALDTTLITDNHQIYDNHIGIHAGTAAHAEGNTVFDNHIGIRLNASSSTNTYASDNVAYGNEYGIVGNRNAVITHNTVRDNVRGIYGNGNYGSNGHFRGTIANNVVYDNTNYAVRVVNGSGNGTSIRNNTFVHGDSGIAIRLDDNARHVTFENNIATTGDADLLRVSQNAQLGFESDYNLFHVAGTGTLFQWGDIAVDNLADWYYEIGYDAHSHVADPRFVDPAGGDYRLLPSSPGVDAGNPASGYVEEPAPNGGRINIGAFGNTADATPSSADLLQILSPHVFDKHQLGRTLDLAWRTHFDDLDTRYADLINDQNPLLHYRLNEEDGSIVTDSSGGGRDGQLVDGGTWGGEGIFGPGADTAANFEGSDNHIRVDDTDGDLDLTHNVSMGMWMNIASFNGATRDVPLIFKGDGNNADGRTFSLWLDPDGRLELTTADDQGSQSLTTDAGLIDFDKWHHVGAVIDRDSGKMHIYLDGEVVASGDVRENAAVSTDEPLYIMASGEGGYYVRPFNGRVDEFTLHGRALSEDEVHDQAVGYRGTVDVELLVDNNDGTYSSAVTLADDLPDLGSLEWDIPADLDTTKDYVIRVTSSEGTQPFDQTEPFRFAGDGNIYYINDGSLDDDVHTTAVGDNLNTGKAADDPMASLNALLAVYELSAGDVVYVDSGTYVPLQNVVLSGEHSGVTFIGAHDADNADAETIFDRGSRSGGYYGFELTGATDVTFEHIHVTNANIGLYAAQDAGSDNLTIRDSVFSHNIEAGVRVLRGNDGLLVEGSTFYGHNPSNHNDPQKQEIGLHYQGSNGTIRDNIAYDHYDHGFSLAITYGDSSDYLVENNTAYNNRMEGISARGADGSTFRDNVVHGNDVGIYVGGVGTVVTGTEAYDNNIGIESQDDALITNNHLIYDNNVGIYAHNQTRVENNTTYDNNGGILASASSSGGPTLVLNNWSFNNSSYGIAGNRTAHIIGNRVFGNGDGIRGSDQHGSGGNRHFRGLIENNLVYANEDVGILLNGTTGSGNARVINNTVYQEVGNAVRITRSPSDVTIANNILWTDRGPIISADEDLSDRLYADHNVYYRGEVGLASVVDLDGLTFDTLADWQAASSAHNTASVEGDPLFLNIDGANDVLGSSREGALDDNFRLAADSPAIDRAHSWWASASDIDGYGRTDDPGTTDAGSSDFHHQVLPDNHFDSSLGESQNWRSTNSSWQHTFSEFSFEFYGESYDRLRIGSNGVISVANNFSESRDADATEAKLRDRLLIAPFWADLSTSSQPENDIFIDEQADELTIRWHATYEPTGETAEFAATLFANGEVRFDYGQMPEELAAVIGISRGNDTHYTFSDLNGEAGIANVDSRSFFLAPGYADIGAYEFRGSSLDQTPPSVEEVTPGPVGDESTTNVSFDRFVVDFTEVLDSINANAPESYRLLRADSGGSFSEVVDLLPQYSAGQSIVTLDVVGGELADGEYQLVIFGDNGVTDVSGVALDGDDDGSAGGDFVRTFTIDTTAPQVAFDSLVTPDTSPELTGSVDDPEADVTVTIDGDVYAAINEGDGTWSLAADNVGPLEPGEYDVHVAATDAAGNVGEATVTDGLVIEAVFTAEVVGRHIFYNNSWFDGDDVAASAADDDAIASDKLALRPGETASFANYSSYWHGINGVMIDIVDLPDPSALSLEDFAFAIGNSDDVENWEEAPLPVSLTVREGEGVDGADRVTLIWEDAAIANTWLEVRVAAGDGTGLADEDVFYFGSAIGETGDSATDAHVTGADEQAVADNPHGPYDPAAVDSPYDFTRDGMVNIQDRLIARANQTDAASALQLITPTAPEPDAEPDFDLFQQYAASQYSPSTHLSSGTTTSFAGSTSTRSWSRPLWMDQQEEDSSRKRRSSSLLESSAEDASGSVDALALVQPIAIVR